ILLILSGLFLAFSHFKEETVYYLILLYYAAFFLIAVSVFGRKTRTVIDGIAINMITFFIAFMPIFATLLYYTIDEKKYIGQNYPDGYTEQRDLHYIIAQLAGFVLLLVLIEPLFKRLFRNWYSKPEQ
ncbi:MAG TPA: hypothetical protein VFM18_12800, partial [Methanosarcina sp.]|nr:hypothetical protein [Methanosarcina sp.]